MGGGTCPALNGKEKDMTKDIGRSKAFRDFWKKSTKVLSENCEFVHDEQGRIIRGKAPNLKKIRDFYKKHDRFIRLRKRK